MRMSFKFFVVAALALVSAMNATAYAADDPQRSSHPIERAFTAADAQSWSEAADHAALANDPLAAKIIDWMRFQQSDAGDDFAAIADFIVANPHWPHLSRLRRNGESALRQDTDHTIAADWFARFPPLSGAGALAHLDALTALGQPADARTLAPAYWRDLDFKRDEETEFQRNYGKHLAAADHTTRLDRLIWDQNYWSAERMLTRVEPAHAALGRARLALMRRKAGVDGAIASVPAALRDAPELQYERLRWRRRKGMDQSARELLFAAPPPPAAHADRWAYERLILARRALLDGHYSEAQRLATNHGLSEGASFAEAEFLAGWISLAFLGEPEAAYKNFERLYNGVSYPISRARGAYWAGRAAQAAGDPAGSARWFRLAAVFPATYYGQRALAELGESDINISFTLPPDSPSPDAPSADSEPVAELAAAVRLLHRYDQVRQIRPFLWRLTELSTSLPERFAVVQLANEIGQPHEAVRAAKRIAQLDGIVPTSGYPLLEIGDRDARTVKQEREEPLVLALIRQESVFDPRAVSPAGARGMMQLLPSTAKRVARATGRSYSRDRLLDDPQYNIALGTAYLDTMLERFDNAPALALAAYNAGPGRVDRWLRQIGDPRSGEIDLVDWIESIPFSETRNYVQRVLETEVVYRRLFLNEQVASVPAAEKSDEVERNNP